MKIGEGKLYGQNLYVPKAVITALELEEGDTVEFHVSVLLQDGELLLRKGELKSEGSPRAQTASPPKPVSSERIRQDNLSPIPHIRVTSQKEVNEGD